MRPTLTARLDSIADVRLGRQRTPGKHSGPNMRPYLRAANISRHGLALHDVKEMHFDEREMEVYRLEVGDILVGEASGSLAEVGKSAIWDGKLPECAFQNTLIRVRSRNINSSHPRYLLHFLQYQFESGVMANISRGVGIRHLGREALADLRVPVLPIDAQHQVVHVLDLVDKLRAKRRESLVLLDRLAQSIFTSLVGDVVMNDRGWNDGRILGDVAEIVSGITKGRKSPAGTMRTVPYLAVANVQAMRLAMAEVKTIDATEAEIERYALMRNDLVLTEGGDPDKLGRGTLWREELSECIHQNHIFRVRLRPDSEIVPLYLNWLIASERGRRYFLKSAKQTTGIASINATQLRQFPLLEPPPDLQRNLADRLVQVDAVKRTHAAHLAELDALFASVQDRAFRGQLFADDSPAPALSSR
jgi:type I restriction enzyme S subunit